MLLASKRFATEASNAAIRLATEFLVPRTGIPLLGTLRDKHGSMEMEIVDHSLGLVAKFSGTAGQAAAAELRTYLMYLTALAPARVVIDLSAVFPVAPHVFESLEAFRQNIEADGGEVQLVGLRRVKPRASADSNTWHGPRNRLSPCHGMDVVQALWS